MRKIIFLDIDGVLNTVSGTLFHREIVSRDENSYDKNQQAVLDWLSKDFSYDALANLNHIIEKIPETEIVISSTWRLEEKLQTMKDWFKGVPKIQEAIIGKTPSLGRPNLTGHNYNTKQSYELSGRGQRGIEIFYWLKHNDLEPETNCKICIIDDDADMYPLMKYLVNTNSYNGLVYTDSLKVLKMLEEKE